MLTFKKKQNTDTQHAHTEVYHGDTFLGYFLPNKSKFAAINENWNFVSKHDLVQYFHSTTKNELIETLEKQVKKEPVILKQHFGIVTKLNF